MNIVSKKEESVLTIVLEGDLDTNTAPTLTSTIDENVGDATTLVLDMNGVNYLSSAGIRAILRAEKTMAAVSGSCKLINVQPAVYKVLEITMLTGSLDIVKA